MRSIMARRGPAPRVSSEVLEGRRLLTAVVVNRILDSDVQGMVTLRDAIAIANASATPTTITFDPTVFATAETIALDGEQLELTNAADPTTITAPAAGVTVSGDAASRVFYVDAGVTASFAGLSITDGKTSAANGGAGLYSFGTVTMTDCIVTTNTSSNFNAGVGNGGTMTLNNVIISDNIATNGTDTGGLVNDPGATLTLTNCSIMNNTAAAGGGVVNNGGTLVMTGGTISGNVATSGQAGGLSNGGTAFAGQSSGTTTLTGVTIENNSATGNGGGVSNIEGSLTLTNCTIDENSVSTAGSSRGGGIYSTGTTAVAGSTFNDNRSPFYGSAVDVEAGSLTLINDTLTSNTAGSGAVNVGAGTADLEGDTVSGNASDGGATTAGGAVICDTAAGAAVTIGNTVVAGNTNAGSVGPDVFGSFLSQGNNLIGATDESTGWTAADLTGTAASPLAPGLSALADNGGPTKTLLPAADSPAIGHGSVALIPSGITTDQRGDPRTVSGAVDIGAVEVGVPSPLSLSVTKSTVPTSLVQGSKLKGSVTVTVTNSGATAVTGPKVLNLLATTADGTSQVVGTARERATIKPGKSTTIAVRVTPTTALSADSYSIVPQLTDATGDTLATAVSGAPVAVATATVDLSATVGAAARAKATAGKTIALTLKITNDGNVNSTGTATITVYLSTDGIAQTIQVTPTVTKGVTVKANGKSASIRLSVKVPAAAAGLQLFPLVVFSQPKGSATAASAAAVTIG